MIVSRKLLSPRGGWSQTLRYVIFASFLALLVTYNLENHPRSHRLFSYGPRQRAEPQDLPPFFSDPNSDTHAIDKLIRDAQSAQEQLLSKQTQTLEETAKRYRKLRGRHPPPGFDKWFEYARSSNAIIVEEFFDRIYHDLRPFWALPAAQIRIKANTYIQVIRVRGGTALYATDNPNRVPWIQLWHSLVAEAALFLPDVDMPINYMDETRVLVPWDVITDYVRREEEQRSMPPASQVSTVFGKDLKALDEIQAPPYDPNWILNDATKYWDHARQSCPTDSPSRNVSSVPDFTDPITFSTKELSYSYNGYIQNWTEAQDICVQPHLRSMHGTFTESMSMVTTHELIPIFGGAKLAPNNDILVPAAIYLSDDEQRLEPLGSYLGWDQKKDKLIWRGTASGGRNKQNNWHHFHRHRFVQALNGTTISSIELTANPAETFDLSPPDVYNLDAQREGNLGRWISEYADVAFTSLECYPAEFDRRQKRSPKCSYTNSYYNTAPVRPLKGQFINKYMPDIDGNSFSGRWRRLMLSTSLPMRATIYKEWHDDRLMPWVHFVPFDNTFKDVYGIMNYFLQGHDHAARRIAIEGKQWSEKVLRRDDMLLYVWRLLLEFARICDDNRNDLGFVDDLL